MKKIKLIIVLSILSSISLSLYLTFPHDLSKHPIADFVVVVVVAAVVVDQMHRMFAHEYRKSFSELSLTHLNLLFKLFYAMNNVINFGWLYRKCLKKLISSSVKDIR